MNFSIHESIGTALLANSIASFMVFLIYYRHRNIDFTSCIWFAIGAIPGSQIGAIVTRFAPETQLSGAFGIVLIIVGAVMWKKGLDRKGIIKRIGKFLRIENLNIKRIIAISIGILVGILSGLFGASGGVWFLIILLLVSGLPLHKSVVGAAFLMSLTAFFATIAHYFYGKVNVIAGILIGISAVVSGNLSARFANKTTEKILLKAISILIVLLGIFILLIKTFTIHL